MNTIAEHNRKIENLIRFGKIIEAKAGLARVSFSDELETDWLPYFVPFAGGVSVHRLPSENESCVVLSPSGLLEVGCIFCGLASNDFAAPSESPDETVVQFPDGAKVVYNHASSHLDISGIATATVTASGNTEINCPQNTINGATTVNGLLTCNQGMVVSGGTNSTATFTGNVHHIGTYTNEGELSSNGVILDTHVHLGDSGGTTGKPS